MDEHSSGRWFGWLSRALLVALAAWVVSSVALGIPHEPGHSIESMRPVQTLHDIAFPIWFGALVGIAGLLAIRVCDALGRSDTAAEATP